MKKLLRKLFRMQEKRTVFMVLHDCDMRVRKAYLTDSGWAACWNNDHWCILMEEGEVVGSSEVKAWFPHSGWPDPKNFK